LLIKKTYKSNFTNVHNIYASLKTASKNFYKFSVIRRPFAINSKLSYFHKKIYKPVNRERVMFRYDDAVNPLTVL